MKIWLEIEILGIDHPEAADMIIRRIEHEIGDGLYYGHDLTVEQCDDPGEQYNRGYDVGRQETYFDTIQPYDS